MNIAQPATQAMTTAYRASSGAVLVCGRQSVCLQNGDQKMKRSQTDKIKAECQRVLDAILMMERCAGWYQYGKHIDEKTHATSPENEWNPGQYTAAVKRASMDLTRALAEVRR